MTPRPATVRRAAWTAALAAGLAVAGGCATAPASTAPGDVGATSGAPASAVAAPSLAIRVGDGPARRLTLGELQSLPMVEAVATRRDGSPMPVRGVPVTALLRLAGLDLAADLGGGTVSSRALVAVATDGYRAAFGLAELDPRFGRPPLLVAWTQADGSPLPPAAGPLQLLVPGDARTSRWVRQLAELTVVVPR